VQSDHKFPDVSQELIPKTVILDSTFKAALKHFHFRDALLIKRGN